MFWGRRLLAVAASTLIVLLLAVGAALWLTWRLPFRPGDFFDEASNSHLATAGFVLTGPGLVDWPRTSSRAAEQTALGMVRSEIRRTLLLHVHFLHTQMPDCLCWVISMGTPGGPAHSSGPPPGPRGPGRLIFRFAFVRADTGQGLLLAEEGTRG